MIDEKENSKEIIIKCDQCGEEFTFPSFIIAVALHGIIFLIGEDDGYFGIVCPKCLKTTLRKDDRKHIESIKNDINRLSLTRSFQDKILKYHSVPYNINEYQERMQICIAYTVKQLDISNRLEFFEVPGGDDSVDLSEGYCTYFLGDLAMGPAMSVCWFKKEAIDDLLETENQTGLKIFPRYRFQDSLHEAVDAFCWNHHFRLDFFEMIIRSLPEGAVRTRTMSHYQQKTTKNFEYLNILDVFPYGLNRLYPDSFNYLTNTHNSETYWESLDDPDPNKQRAIENAPSHGNMISEVWKYFNREHVQETLSTLSNRFIFEFVELAQKIDFSCGLVWDLKESYLKQLYGSLKSQSKMQAIKNEMPEAEIKRVLEAERAFPGVEIISRDSAINDIKIKIFQLAPIKGTDIDILLLGERGTGKELFARAIHESSKREGKFIPVNCASIPEYLFESEFFGYRKGAFTGAEGHKKGSFENANGGTIFLDEIGALNMRFQARFLRVIQEREIQPVGAGQPEQVDVKMVFATNRDLNEMVENGEFRDDLLDRIDGFTFEIPPLRKRKNDIPFLVEHFIEKYDKKRELEPELPPLGVTEGCMDILRKHDWKGNVRQLKKIIKKIIILSRYANNSRGDIGISDLPEEILDFHLSKKPTPKAGNGKRKLSGNTKFADDELIYWMKELQNNKTKVAETLNADVRTIRRRCKPLGL